MRLVHVIIAGVVVAVALVLLLYAGTPASQQAQGLTIVASIEPLASDVEQLVCGDDKVYFIVPSGADPHTYQLRPGDYAKLKEADVLVLIGGLDVEAGILRLVERGEIGAVLLVILDTPGVELLRKPDGLENVHFPIYDPFNYAAFLGELSSILADTRPGCENHYMEAYENLIAALSEATSPCSGALEDMNTIVDLPPAQYAIAWMGANVTAIVQSEPGRPLAPGELERIRAAIGEGKIDFVVVTVDSQGAPVSRAGEWLLEVADEAGIPVVEVPAPFVPGSTLAKIRSVVESVNETLGVCGG